MESARYFLLRTLSSFSLRIAAIILFVTIGLTLFITGTAMKAHSESDVRYHQESIFLGSGLAASKPEVTILDSEEDNGKVIAMSFEVDKVTPTPTPQIDPASDGIWLQIAECESHKNWNIDTGNGYYGGLQFSLGAWASVGGSGKPSEASAEEQITKGKILQLRRGWGPWGGCSKRFGLL